jgi:hypothetical protein
MIIKKKENILEFLENFSLFAARDFHKDYFVFRSKHGGVITLMKYNDNSFSYHRKNEMYWDLYETPFDEVIKIERFVWEHRKGINKKIAKCLTT